MKDIQCGLVPLCTDEVMGMLRQMQAFPLLEGYRGQAGIDLPAFAALICRLSRLMEIAPGICEVDINPILAQGECFHAVDVRIRLEK